MNEDVNHICASLYLTPDLQSRKSVRLSKGRHCPGIKLNFIIFLVFIVNADLITKEWNVYCMYRHSPRLWRHSGEQVPVHLVLVFNPNTSQDTFALLNFNYTGSWKAS